ncbi:MAG: T9SS type A sorting domain-containing protein [candidate division Zixibacteria bacterium]|nr:T9SS type A sorting domain-containing protein [candidate division Zixibacteria bacterium]
MKKRLILIAMILAILVSTSGAEVINIPEDYETIQEGIDASTDGDMVLVAPETYNENINFHGRKIIVASYHFTTGDTAFITSTIIDGGENGSVVMFCNFEDSLSVLTGFTIRNGSTMGLGGGIQCWEAGPKITHNKIVDNTAGEGGGIGCGCCAYCGSGPIIDNNEIADNSAIDGMGGGISCNRVSGAKITNNLISYNTASIGGGIGFDDTSDEWVNNNTICYNLADDGGGISCSRIGQVTVTNNEILGNSAERGGGIKMYENSGGWIDSNTIIYNSTDDGGGIYCVGNSAPSISSNILVSNTANNIGGGIYCQGAEPSISANSIESNSAYIGGGIYCYEVANLIIDNNNIEGNFVDETGGGILCSNGTPTIINNIISGNSGSWGKGIACVNSDASIRNNLITLNQGFGHGGGLFCSHSDPQIDHNTITDNSAGRGGGAYCYNSNPIITSTILWDNSATYGSQIYREDSNPILSYCDVEGGWNGEGNINADPLFCDPQTLDFWLAENSPCVGSGQNGENIGAYGVGCEAIGVCCDVNMIPDEDPIVVPPGGSFGLTGLIGNPTEDPISTDVWVGVIYMGAFHQLWNFPNIQIDPGQYLNSHLNQNVPNNAPAGTYDYVAYCGDKPEICDSANFQFTVSGARTEGGADEWILQGGWGTNEIVTTEFSLANNHPNPFNAGTNISYHLSVAGNVTLEIYNLMGQRVAILVHGHNEAGQHTVAWDASRHSSGVYFYRLTIGEKVLTKRMTLLK